MAYWHTKSLHDHNHLEALHAAEGSAAKTLAELAGHDGKWSTSAERLAKRAGVSKPTVVNAVKKLEQLGIVSRHREGRRSATVYTWHSCTPGCDEASHTGKKDTRASRFLSGLVAADTAKNEQLKSTPKKPAGQDGGWQPQRPMTKRKRRSEAKKSVSASVVKPAEWSSEPLSGQVSGQVSGQLALPPKDKTWPITETEPELTSGQAPEADPMWQYGALLLDVMALADTDWVDALTAEVVCGLLMDPQTSSTVTGLAVELWGDIPSPLSFEQVELLRSHFETRTGFDTSAHYMAIHRYSSQGDTVTSWRDLPEADKDKWLRQYAYATAARQVSDVARSVKEDAPKQFGQLFTSPPVDDLIGKLQRLDSFTAPE